MKMQENIKNFFLKNENKVEFIKNKIAIIGGGPAAVSVCMQIVEEFKNNNLNEPTEIMVFEKENFIGPGLPYSKKENCYILNLPKEVMEPVYGNKGKFAKWSKEYTDCPQNTSFPPRYYFGLYLKFLAEKLEKESQYNLVKIKYYTNSEVLDLKEDKEILTVYTSKENYQINYAIFCTGHMPSSTYTQLIGTPGYIHDPWKEGVYENIDKSKPIVIIGTRLTAIDVAMKLSSCEHQGKIIMVSRSGLLPTVLSKEIPPYPLKYLTLENFDIITKSGLKPLSLDSLLTLFWKEISEAENQIITLESLCKSYKDISPLDWINRQIEISEKKTKPWQQVLFAIYPIIPNIWSMLKIEDRKEFIRKYKSLFLTYLAAFPLDNAYRVQSLLKQEKLIVEGGVQSIIKDKNNLFNIKLENSKNIKSEILINATGPGYNPLLAPLYQNLIFSGLLRKHHAGGIDVDPQTLKVFNKHGKLHQRLFAIGEITSGACLATTDMTRVSIQSGRVATTILGIRQAVLKKNKHLHSLFFRNIGQVFFHRAFLSIPGKIDSVGAKNLKILKFRV